MSQIITQAGGQVDNESLIRKVQSLAPSANPQFSGTAIFGSPGSKTDNNSGAINTTSLLVSTTQTPGSQDAFLAWFGNNSPSTPDLILDANAGGVGAGIAKVFSVVPSVEITANQTFLATSYIHSIWKDDGANRTSTFTSSFYIQSPTINGTITSPVNYGIYIASQNNAAFTKSWGVFSNDSIFGSDIVVGSTNLYFGNSTTYNSATGALIKYNGSTALLFEKGDQSGYLGVTCGALNVATGGINVTGGGVLNGVFSFANQNPIISTSSPPATATSTGTTGAIAWDANFIYVCVATNSWKRVGIAAW